MSKRYIDANKLRKNVEDLHDCYNGFSDTYDKACIIGLIDEQPTADVAEIPKTGIGDLSDGYHTFNGLYEQRMILFAALVKAYKERSWKSYRHEDGEYCFGGGWFIVGIDTPEGSYTYHYENKYWDMFDCQDIPRAKHWDGHTEADAETRLMSLPDVVERKKGKWIPYNPDEKGFANHFQCSECSVWQKMEVPHKTHDFDFCPNCGADMRKERDNGRFNEDR